MDIYDYLKLDHDQVNHLFKQFEKAELPVRQKQIVDLIAQELLVHAKSEEDTFYKALEKHEESRPEALHGEKEHKEIEEQISSILKDKNTGSNWRKKVDKLKEIVTHHVNEEEGAIFKKAKKCLSQEQSCDLKEQMHYLKQDLLRKLKK